MTDAIGRTWRSLVKKSDFHKVYDGGAKRIGRLLVVYLLPAEDTAWAVVASRKVGSAVRRNRAKRLLREAFRHSELVSQSESGQNDGVQSVKTRFFAEIGGETPDQPGKAGLWVVLVARRNILSAKSQIVQAELDDLLSRPS